MENTTTLTGTNSPSLKQRASQSRLQKRHHPLDETKKWANNYVRRPQSPPQAAPSSSSSAIAQKLPHHTSLTAGNVLQARNDKSALPNKAEDKRVSAISSEGARTSNRDSQISTVSTNASGTGRRKVAVGPWRLGVTIGKGATGRVRKARHRFTGQDAAVKIVSKKSAEMFKSKSLATMDIMTQSGGGGQKAKKMIPFGIERECVIMKLIEHPNVIKLYDMWENRGEL